MIMIIQSSSTGHEFTLKYLNEALPTDRFFSLSLRATATLKP